VWIALTYRGHIHYAAATTWLRSMPDSSELCFCRMTQLGFLRLLTTPAVMGNRAFSQAAAWDVYDDWLENGRAAFVEEPASVDPTFRSLSQSIHSAPKDWADSYISAFAQVAGLQLVTFNQALQRRTGGSLLLKP
jgi:toxin-antitoxin system PIN domain toxin